jgi:hypothetical protein
MPHWNGERTPPPRDFAYPQLSLWDPKWFTGYMAHASCAAVIAAAALAMIRARRNSAIVWVVISFSLLVYACLIRPLTGVVSLCVMLAFGIWNREDQARLKSYPLYRYWRLCAGSSIDTGIQQTLHGIILAFSLRALQRCWRPERDKSQSKINFATFVRDRWALEETLIFTFPFVFLLAAYTAIREWKRAPNVRFLAVFFPALVIAHVVQTENSASFIGERYYFAGFLRWLSFQRVVL